MTCSEIDGIDEAFLPYGLPPIPVQDQKTIWNGRTVQVLHDVRCQIQIDTILKTVADQTIDPHFYERLFTDLTFEDLENTEEDDREWEFALAQPLFPPNSSENLTLEQFLERTGMIFDQQLGHYVDCKSWIKRMAHSAEKKLRKAAKKTADFVIEHKKEIAIGVAIVVGGAALGALGVVIAQALVATDTASTIGGAIAAAAAGKAADEANKHYDRKHAQDDHPDKERSPSNSQTDQSSPYASTPQPSTSNDLMKQVFGNLFPSNPTPPPNQGIYALDADSKRARDVSVPPSSRMEAPSHSFTPPSSDNIAQQFFNKVFQANPDLNPYSGSGKTHSTDKSKSDVPTASPTEIVAAAPSAPNPFKSDFGTYLDNLHRSQIDPNYQQYTHAPEPSAIPPVSSPTENAAASTPPIETPVTQGSNAFKSDFGTYLDNLHRSQISSNFENGMHSAAKNDAAPRIIENVPEPVRVECRAKAEALVNLLNNLRQGIETMGRGMIEKELLDPDSPLDPLNVHQPKAESRPFPARHDPAFSGIKTLDKEPLHMDTLPLMILQLPSTPNVGAVPIISPNGKVDWVLISADWKRFQFTQEEFDKGTINLYDHFKDFMPKNGQAISIITSQNGINTSLEEFLQHSKADTYKIAVAMLNPSQEDHQQPLYLGLYNNTEGLIKDLVRIPKEMQHKKQNDMPSISSPDDFASGMSQIAQDMIPNFQGFEDSVKELLRNSNETQNVKTTREFLSGIAQTAKEINPEFRWLLIEHSEGGLIYCRSFEGMSKETKKVMKDNTINIALGSAEPISKEMASEPINFYSDKDYVTKRFAEKLMNDPNYDIRIIPCLSSTGELSFYIADHARDGTTYDKALEKQIKELKKRVGFYDGQEHE